MIMKKKNQICLNPLYFQLKAENLMIQFHKFHKNHQNLELFGKISKAM